MDEKVRLMNAMVEAEKSLEMYEGLAKSSREQVAQIKSQLDASYQPAGSRYTADELAQCRRRIVGVLGDAGWMHPRDLTDRMHDYGTDLVMREVHKLVDNPLSDVMWNQRKGSASQYCRFRTA